VGPALNRIYKRIGRLRTTRRRSVGCGHGLKLSRVLTVMAEEATPGAACLGAWHGFFRRLPCDKVVYRRLHPGQFVGPRVIQP
jgi:hypothetical protein